MKITALKILLVASVFTPVAVYAQGDSKAPTTATFIPKEDIDKVNQTEQSFRTKDENVMVVDIGNENFALGVVHRSSTRTPRPAPAGGGNAAAAERKPCGREMATLPSGGLPGGITHDHQTEGYIIISGGGTMFVDGYIVNGRHGDQPTWRSQRSLLRRDGVWLQESGRQGR